MKKLSIIIMSLAIATPALACPDHQQAENENTTVTAKKDQDKAKADQVKADKDKADKAKAEKAQKADKDKTKADKVSSK